MLVYTHTQPTWPGYEAKGNIDCGESRVVSWVVFLYIFLQVWAQCIFCTQAKKEWQLLCSSALGTKILYEQIYQVFHFLDSTSVTCCIIYGPLCIRA